MKKGRRISAGVIAGLVGMAGGVPNSSAACEFPYCERAEVRRTSILESSRSGRTGHAATPRDGHILIPQAMRSTSPSPGVTPRFVT